MSRRSRGLRCGRWVPLGGMIRAKAGDLLKRCFRKADFAIPVIASWREPTIGLDCWCGMNLTCEAVLQSQQGFFKQPVAERRDEQSRRKCDQNC